MPANSRPICGSTDRWDFPDALVDLVVLSLVPEAQRSSGRAWRFRAVGCQFKVRTASRRNGGWTKPDGRRADLVELVMFLDGKTRYAAEAWIETLRDRAADADHAAAPASLSAQA